MHCSQRDVPGAAHRRGGYSALLVFAVLLLGSLHVPCCYTVFASLGLSVRLNVSSSAWMLPAWMLYACAQYTPRLRALYAQQLCHAVGCAAGIWRHVRSASNPLPPHRAGARRSGMFRDAAGWPQSCDMDCAVFASCAVRACITCLWHM